ncbi:MAG: N-acetyl-gamma-glutamyl-phosphate reductase [Sphingomonas sp.]|nr:N-acetyl-gamma-glutamyl-phosphate reductase [Sphingomonas sp.]
MTVSVFIDGAAGTTGLEIHDRLAKRADLSVVTLNDADRKNTARRTEALNDADFVILCLPDDAARDAVSLISNNRTRVIDASTAHRVDTGWTYGFPELDPGHADQLASATRVSNPGCYPTGFLALVRPLVRAGLIPADWPLTVNAASGYSGGGKAMIEEFQGAGTPPTAYRAYGLSAAHKHVAEMHKHARIEHPPIFTPSVANVYRGMIVEVPVPLHVFPRRPDLGACEAALRDAYRDSPVISVADAAGINLVMIEEHAGTDSMTLRVCGNADTGQAMLIATLDNLGKGAAGAAVQNLNIMAGFDPVAGLVI